MNLDLLATGVSLVDVSAIVVVVPTFDHVFVFNYFNKKHRYSLYENV